jgi:hypothetical protein
MSMHGLWQFSQLVCFNLVFRMNCSGVLGVTGSVMAYLWHMRTTVELPDELLIQAKTAAASQDISLRQFFMEAVLLRLSPEKAKVRRAPPAIGDAGAPPIKAISREQIDEALFG